MRWTYLSSIRGSCSPIGVSRRRGHNPRSRRTTRRGPFLSAALRPRLVKSERVELGGKGRHRATPAQTATRADRLKCAETRPCGGARGASGSTEADPPASIPRISHGAHSRSRSPGTARGSRSLVKIGRMLEAVESGQIEIDSEGGFLLGDDPGQPSMRHMCLLRAGIHRRHAIVIPVVLEMRGVAGQ